MYFTDLTFAGENLYYTNALQNCRNVFINFCIYCLLRHFLIRKRWSSGRCLIFLWKGKFAIRRWFLNATSVKIGLGTVLHPMCVIRGCDCMWNLQGA